MVRYEVVTRVCRCGCGRSFEILTDRFEDKKRLYFAEGCRRKAIAQREADRRKKPMPVKGSVNP